jgi:hypothetical protein
MCWSCKRFHLVELIQLIQLIQLIYPPHDAGSISGSITRLSFVRRTQHTALVPKEYSKVQRPGICHTTSTYAVYSNGSGSSVYNRDDSGAYGIVVDIVKVVLVKIIEIPVKE